MKTLKAQAVLAANCQRLRGDLSQADIASRASRAGFKIDQKTVSRMESPDYSNSTLKKIEAVAAAFSVPAWKLLLPANITQMEHHANKKAKQIVSIVETLNDEGLTALLFQAEFLKANTKYLNDSQSKEPMC